MVTNKTKPEWDQDIITIIMKIQQEFPELSKYIPEMPIKVSQNDKPGIDIKDLEEYHNSLEVLLVEYSTRHTGKNVKNDPEQSKLSGYPPYPPSEDIYNNEEKEVALNPENLSKNKTPNQEKGTLNEKDFEEDMSGSDLDIPGSELDDQQESVGSEDEENNYYSLGGDNHNDLEEDEG